VLGIQQLQGIDARVKKKRELFTWYHDALANIEAVTLLPTDLEETAPWFMDVLLPSHAIRSELAAYLKEQQIGTRVFYPPINHQPPYAYYPKGSFPVSEDLAYRGLWLPSSLGLDVEQVHHICHVIAQFFEQRL
jgi:perosamine synthetase